MGDSIPIQKTKVFRVKVDSDKGIAFEDQCRNEGTNVNAKLKNLIETSLKGQKKYFLAGKNKFSYDMVNDKFSWLVELDNGEKKEILSDISLDFLKNVKEEIEKAAIERENWIQGKKRGSPAVPSRLVE